MDGDTLKYKINNAIYKAKFTLKTSGQKEEINFSRSAIRGMDIEENFLEPFTNGNIYLNNPADFIEDGRLVRGDGKDELTIEFYPKSDPKGKDGGNFDKVSIAPLTYKFTISSEINSTSKTDRLNNFKTYRLIDYNYARLNEQIPYGTRFRGSVGAIIRNILVDKIGEDKVAPIESSHHGPGMGGEGGPWEFGEHDINILPEHILPPDTFRYSDLIKYLLKINYKRVGDTHVRLFLNWDRETGKFQYVPLSKLFLEHQANIIEGFLANDIAGPIKENPNNPAKAGADTPTNVYNAPLMNTDLSTPMLVYTNAYIQNLQMSNYDPLLGEHVMKILRVREVKEEWKKLFVDPFGYVGGKAQPWLILNKDKTSELFRSIGFPWSTEVSMKLAEAELTTNMTFFNLQLSFETLGNTGRMPGKFIDVSATRPQKEEERAVNPFDNQEVDHRSDAKLLGTWFITKVRHEFSSSKVDNYTNTLQCIKPHIGPDKKLYPVDC
tara:strand:- start:1588 stop:3069 length:1482 start_codon:yes stop_codon:yes gene_type:complete